MKYKIIADSSCELTEEMKRELGIDLVPFIIDIDEHKFVDDEELDINLFIRTMNASPNPIRTACASPGTYVELFGANQDCDGIFVITISAMLSGSNNSAETARKMFLEDHPDAKIYVIDSKTAVSGETLIALKLKELMDRELSFEEIIMGIEDFITEQKTLFSLEDMDNLIKNGRITKTKGLIANMLNIKPVMHAVNGEIEIFEIVRGVNKSLKKMAEGIGKICDDTQNRTLVIAHVQAPEKADLVKAEAEKAYEFKDIIVVPTKGLSSGYAADKGVVISF